MGVNTPSLEADDFIPPGGITAPDHFTYEYARHLINNKITPVFNILDIENPEEKNQIAQEAKRELLQVIEHLLTRYADDLESRFQDWCFFLKALKGLVRNENWQEVCNLYNDNKNSLPGLRAS